MSTNIQMSQPKALLFDVFGTVVDWRTTVTKYLERRSLESLNSNPSSNPTAIRGQCSEIDWPAFAQEWRDSYYGFTRDQNLRKANHEPSPFKTVDDHHLDSLRALLQHHAIAGLWTDDQVFEVSRIWHYLDGWPDSFPGLTALKNKGLIICTLSNGNIELLTDMATYAHLPWTHIFSADQFGEYKPHPSVYTSACAELGLEPGQCAMVAAHLADLEAARECGLQTIYVERFGEESWPTGKIDDAKSKGWVDMWVNIGGNSVGGGILEIARNFGDKE